MNASQMRAVGAVFYRCPHTGRILGPTGAHDDKVLCGCGKTVRNPDPAGMPFTDAPGTHIKRFLPRASAEDYVAQRDAPKKD